MEILKITPENQEVLEMFMKKRKQKYVVYNNEVYKSEWTTEALELRKKYLKSELHKKYFNKLKSHQNKINDSCVKNFNENQTNEEKINH